MKAAKIIATCFKSKEIIEKLDGSIGLFLPQSKFY